jgi:hypothetical protein
VSHVSDKVVPFSLQHYYQVFLPNKPHALYKPLPQTSAAMSAVTEQYIKDSLPGPDQLHEWQLAAMLPYMLSQEVVGDQSFMEYAKMVAKGEVGKGMDKAGEELVRDLEIMDKLFLEHSMDLGRDHPDTWYMVMDPNLTANSILI